MRVEIGGEGVECLSAEPRLDLGTIRGHGTAEAEWVVRAAPGAAIRIEAWHPKAGRVQRSLTP